MADHKYLIWQEEHNLELLEAMAAEGLDYAQIAERVKVSESTFREWRKKYPAISAAIKRGRDHAIAQVENALHKRAIGYNVPIRKALKVKRVDYDEKTGRRLREHEEIVEAIEEMHVPADTTAAIFYLTNRKPEAWRRNGAEVTVDGDESGTGVLMLPERAEAEE